MPDDQEQQELPDIFPGAVDPEKGIALSYVESRNRYGIDYHTIERWVQKGILNVVGTYIWRKQEQPLIWSEDLKNAMQLQRYRGKHSTAATWKDLVLREYGKRGLTPPPEAIEDAEETCSCTKPCCTEHRKKEQAETIRRLHAKLTELQEQFNKTQ